MLVEQLKENYFFAVIRGKDKEDAKNIARYAIKGGIYNIEITFSTPKADEVIKELIEEFKDDKKVIVGAGTVMNLEHASLAKNAGAKFLVSPHFSEELAKYAVKNNVEYSPGCGTVTEVVNAINAGAKIVKLFPGGTIGKDFIKAIHGPIPDVDLMPSGGVSASNVKEWRDAGACAVGIGSALSAKVSTEGYESVERVANEFIKAFD